MADTPCSVCDNGYNGKAFVAYVNYYDDQQLIQCRLRLCMNCIADHFLILVENADRRNERNQWILAREERQWRTGAHSETTEIAKLAANTYRQTSATTRTFIGGAVEPRKSSATNVGSEQRSQQRQSSKRSNDADSSDSKSANSDSSLTKESRSGSKSSSTGRTRARTKSTGS